MTKTKLFIRALLLGYSTFLMAMHSFSQIAATNSGGQIQTVQPKIMVIPFTKEGEDIRTILEADVNKREAITKIKEAFDNRGFTTVDFTAKLKAAKDNMLFTSDNQTDIKSQIIQMSGADIYVQAEVDVISTSGENRVTLILTAYEASTGNSLSNKVGKSPINRTPDIGLLASKAVESVADEFLNTMQAKFSDIVENGKSVVIDFSFDQSSVYNMQSPVGAESIPLQFHLDLWMSENAYKNNYTTPRGSDLRIIFDDVRIPLKDQATGQNYNPNKFSLEIFKFLKSIGLQSSPLVNGNTIYITIK